MQTEVGARGYADCAVFFVHVYVHVCACVSCVCRYRKPRSSYKYLRPELQQRGAAFKKGGAYLERYVLLIAFTYYLEHVGVETSESCDTYTLYTHATHMHTEHVSALLFVHGR